MSLLNLALSNQEFLYDAIRHTMPSTQLTYFGAVLISLYGVLAVVYCGAMSLLHLVSTMNVETRKQLEAVQLLLHTQTQKLQSLELELETHKQQAQIMFHTWTHASGQTDLTVQAHGSRISDYANKFADCVKAINSNTATMANHSQVLKHMLQHLHDQNAAMMATHGQVQQHTQQLERLSHVVEDLDALSEQVDDSFAMFESKLEDAIYHFNQSNDRLMDEPLSSVEKCLEKTERTEMTEKDSMDGKM